MGSAVNNFSLITECSCPKLETRVDPNSYIMTSIYCIELGLKGRWFTLDGLPKFTDLDVARNLSFSKISSRNFENGRLWATSRSMHLFWDPTISDLAIVGFRECLKRSWDYSAVDEINYFKSGALNDYQFPFTPKFDSEHLLVEIYCPPLLPWKLETSDLKQMIG